MVKIMAERGLSVAHTTILRWVRRYTPEFNKPWSRFSVTPVVTLQSLPIRNIPC